MSGVAYGAPECSRPRHTPHTGSRDIAVKDNGIFIAPPLAMKSAAAVQDALYNADTTPPPEGEADPYNAPTRVGYLVGTTDAEVSAALTPAPLPAFSSFFPPDASTKPVVPPTRSGEYEKVVFETAGKKLEFEPQVEEVESVDFKPIALAPILPPAAPAPYVPPAQEATIIIPRPRSTPPLATRSSVGWMFGLALLTASAVFVALWLTGALVR